MKIVFFDSETGEQKDTDEILVVDKDGKVWELFDASNGYYDVRETGWDGFRVEEADSDGV